MDMIMSLFINLMHVEMIDDYERKLKLKLREKLLLLRVNDQRVSKLHFDYNE